MTAVFEAVADVAPSEGLTPASVLTGVGVTVVYQLLAEGPCSTGDGSHVNDINTHHGGRFLHVYSDSSRNIYVSQDRDTNYHILK